MKKSIALLGSLIVSACLALTACSAGGRDYGYDSPADYPYFDPDGNDGEGYEYGAIIENGFVSAETPSYFSLDRNTAGYSLVRRAIEANANIPPDSVRIEEMINYFDYSYPLPDGEAAGVSGYLTDCPWTVGNKLFAAGVRTVERSLTEGNANYVFLIDTSGSMSGDDRLGLAKYGLNLLVDELGGSDLISIVTYASGCKTLLDGGECSDGNKADLKKKISSLRAYGATYGEKGIQRAYEVAESHYITGGNNRVILISDGDFNCGISDPDEMKEFVQEKAASGVYLSVLGVGMGNLRSNVLETLALNGNGNYAYLDSKTEAEKVFRHDLKGTLITVAKDAKAGVTFTENVEKYRLIGYDSKIISEDDFNDENADTGEIGSNLCVTALYELTLKEGASGKIADVELRYKNALENDESRSVKCEIDTLTPSSDDLGFISCVAEFGLILRQSEYKGDASLENVINRLEDLSEYISGDAYKSEFVRLVGKYSENAAGKSGGKYFKI